MSRIRLHPTMATRQATRRQHNSQQLRPVCSDEDMNRSWISQLIYLSWRKPSTYASTQEAGEAGCPCTPASVLAVGRL
jgi:hypothetical protein